MKRLIMTPLVLALAFAGCGDKPAADTKAAPAEQAAGPKKDAPAPELALEKIIRGGQEPVKSWADLKGKAVVLEFWATWCDPCVKNIPHMNELAEKFKDKPVVFISLTRDKQDVVEKFMDKHEMKGNVAVEAAAAFKSFKVRGIPHTILVDKEGVIKAISYPSMITQDSIEALLAGRPVPGDIVKHGGEEAKAAEPAKGGDSLASFYVFPAGDGSRTSTRTGETEFTYEGGTLAAAISRLMNNAQVVEYKGVDQKLLDARYTISCKIPGVSGADNRARLRELAVAGLTGAFPLSIKTVRGNRKVLVLKLAAGRAGPAKAKNPNAEFKTSTGEKSVEIEVRGYPIAGLRGALQDWIKTPVLDETGLMDNLDYDFGVSSRELKSVNAELKKLGLELAESRRDVDIAVVSGIKTAQAK